MKFVYTKKAEKDGVGKVGTEVKPKGLTMAYLQLHGYCEDKADDAPTAETSALAQPGSDGAVRRARRVRP